MEDEDKTREQLLDELKKNRLDLERSNLAMSVANDGMYDWDVENNSIYFDSRYYTMAGYEPNEFPGTLEEWAKRVHPEDFERVDKVVQAYLAGEIENYNEKFRFRCKNEEWMWIRARVKIVSKNKYGEPLRIVGTHTDITAEVKLEEQLQQSQKMESLGIMAGGIAHEFNNVLAVVKGYTEMSILNISDNTPVRSYLEEVSVASVKATELVQQILLFSRQEPPNFEAFNPILALKQALKIARATTSANIEIISEFQIDDIQIMGNTTQIYQVTTNLINNAVHAIGETGGEIKITAHTEQCNERLLSSLSSTSASKSKPCFRLTVQDTGCGISKENLNQIFDPFFSTKEKEQGTGLGLSVVHGIIENHAGKITVDSDAGIGTVFNIYLPLTEVKETKDSNQQPSIPNTKGTGKLLLVEDQKMLANLYKKYFESNGYEVVICDNGKEALCLFKTNPQQFDLVFSDMEMPIMTGKQLANEILKIQPNFPIILSSGYSNAMSEQAAQKIGIKKYLSKPIKLSDLSQEIKSCLE